MSLKPQISTLFPGPPSHSTPDISLVWEFLCTFSRVLNLEPIVLYIFVVALAYRPITFDKDSQDSNVPCRHLYVAKAHIAFLKVILSDDSSKNWWWSSFDSSENSECVDAKILVKGAI